MSLRISGRITFIALMAGAAACGVACSSEFENCDANRSCPGDDKGDSGSGGDAGEGNDPSGGSSGKGGTSQGGNDGGGDAGTGAGGDAGEGDAGQGNAGEGGEGGEGGSGEDANAVHGIVKSTMGFPLANWKVVLDGVETLTDEDGKFTVSGAGAEYDLLIAPTDHHLRLYQGLTTREPVVVMTLKSDDPGYVAKSATVSGTVSNALVGSTGIEVWQNNLGPSTYAPDFITALLPNVASDVNFTQPVSWSSPDDPLPIELFVANTDGATWRTGSATLNVTDGADFTNLGIPVADRPTRIVTVSVDSDDALTPSALFSCVSSICSYKLDSIFPAEAPLPTGLPASQRVAVRVLGQTEAGLYGACAVVPDDQDAIGLSLQAPPVVHGPESGAPVDEDTVFSWDPYPEGVHFLKVTGSTAFLLEVITAETSFSVSMIEGVELIPALQHSWFMTGIGPSSSVDDHVAPLPFLEQVGGSMHAALTSTRTFTP